MHSFAQETNMYFINADAFVLEPKSDTSEIPDDFMIRYRG